MVKKEVLNLFIVFFWIIGTSVGYIGLTQEVMVVIMYEFLYYLLILSMFFLLCHSVKIEEEMKQNETVFSISSDGSISVWSIDEV